MKGRVDSQPLAEMCERPSLKGWLGPEISPCFGNLCAVKETFFTVEFRLSECEVVNKLLHYNFLRNVLTPDYLPT